MAHSAKDVEAANLPEPMSQSSAENGQRDAQQDTKAPTAASSASPSRTLARRLGARPKCFTSTAQEVGFVAQATIATATASFLTGASVVITASIGRDLGMTQGEITWIGASTSLTAGAFQLGLGQLADLLGRRMIFMAGMASFSLLALFLGFARDPFWMDIVCGLLGVSSAMVVPPAIGILGAAYDVPSKRKNLAFSAFSAGNPLGFVFGSIFCGIATRLFSWRAAYWLLAIMWAVFTLVAWWAVPKVEAYDTQQSLRERLKSFWKIFDSVGTVLTIFGTGLFAAAITLGPSDGWKSPQVLAMLIGGIALLVLFIFWEKAYPTPLMPAHIWKDRNFTCIILILVLGMMAFLSATFWLSFYMQTYQNLDTLTVALHLLPMAIFGLLWNVIAGSILHRVNNTLIMALACLAYIVANVLLAVMKPDSSYWAFIFPALVLNVVGADFQFNVANMYVMQSLPSHQQSLAGGIFNTLIRLCTVVAFGISTAVYTSVAGSPEGMADPMLKFTRTWQVSVALSAATVLPLPFLRLGTQGNTNVEDKDTDMSKDEKVIPTAPVPVAPASDAQPIPSTKSKEEN